MYLHQAFTEFHTEAQSVYNDVYLLVGQCKISLRYIELVCCIMAEHFESLVWTHYKPLCVPSLLDHLAVSV